MQLHNENLFLNKMNIYEGYYHDYLACICQCIVMDLSVYCQISITWTCTSLTNGLNMYLYWRLLQYKAFTGLDSE